MLSIPFSQLRVAKNLDQLGEWLRAGETVALLYRKRVVAHFIPAKPWPLPDEEDVLNKSVNGRVPGNG